LADYAGRNFETESAVPWAPPQGGVSGTLGHRRKFSSEQGRSEADAKQIMDFVRAGSVLDRAG
jgi:hypothetical protein